MKAFFHAQKCANLHKHIRRPLFALLAGLFAIAIAAAPAAKAAKISDIANIVGVRSNQLIGYGLVVGLAGSGDGSSSEFTITSIANMLGSMNIKIDPKDIKSKNTAAVMISANLPAFARAGDRIDVAISSLGDAKSLVGGTLLLSPLKGVDGNIYAIAQGALAIPQGAPSKTSATIAAGASVERELGYELGDVITLSLKRADFSAAAATAAAINAAFDDLEIARAIDSKSVRIEKPAELGAVEFIAQIEALEIPDALQRPKVVINERSGTIVSGVDVAVSPVLISQGAITIKIAPNSDEQAQKGELDIGDGSIINPATQTLRVSGSSVTLANVARALNKLGATPEELINIIKNLKAAGAISAELEFI